MESLLFLGYGFWAGVFLLFIVALGTVDTWRKRPYKDEQSADYARHGMMIWITIAAIAWFLILALASFDETGTDESWRQFVIAVARVVTPLLMVKLLCWLALFNRKLPWRRNRQ